MPRASKTKSRLHTSAVSLPSKLKGVDGELEQGSLSAHDASLSIPMPLSLALDEPSTSRAQKRADFIRAVQSAPHPYLVKSKSHLRREKRKGKSELSTNLSSLESALDHVLPADLSELQNDEEDGDGSMKKKEKEKKKSRAELEEEKRIAIQRLKRLEKEKGMIGEGKGRTLGEKKRRQVIQESAKRIPAVMAHPAYQSNPWAAIREHVGNTVVSKK